MALIDCPECGREVSDSAAVCPACAYPLVAVTPTVPPRALSTAPEYKWWKTALSIAGRVFLGVILAAVGGEEEDSVAAIIGGVVIAGSAIPTWYRAKIDRLRGGKSTADIEYRVDDRLAEVEQRQQEQMESFARMHSGQLAELEERLDFAERLLAKREQIGPG